METESFVILTGSGLCCRESSERRKAMETPGVIRNLGVFCFRRESSERRKAMETRNLGVFCFHLQRWSGKQ